MLPAYTYLPDFRERDIFLYQTSTVRPSWIFLCVNLASFDLSCLFLLGFVSWTVANGHCKNLLSCVIIYKCNPYFLALSVLWSAHML